VRAGYGPQGPLVPRVLCLDEFVMSILCNDASSKLVAIFRSDLDVLICGVVPVGEDNYGFATMGHMA
jgi:hypothetical protein